MAARQAAAVPLGLRLQPRLLPPPSTAGTIAASFWARTGDARLVRVPPCKCVYCHLLPDRPPSTSSRGSSGRRRWRSCASAVIKHWGAGDSRCHEGSGLLQSRGRYKTPCPAAHDDDSIRRAGCEESRELASSVPDRRRWPSREQVDQLLRRPEERPASAQHAEAHLSNAVGVDGVRKEIARQLPQLDPPSTRAVLVDFRSSSVPS